MRAGVASILFGALAVLLTVSAVVSAFVSLGLLDTQREQLTVQHLESRANVLSNAIRARCRSRDCDWAAALNGAEPKTTWVMTRNFQVVFGECPTWFSRHPKLQDAFTARQHQTVRHETSNQDIMVSIRPIELSDGGTIVLGLSSPWDISQTYDHMLVLVLILSANLVLILIFGVYLVHRTVVSPIAELEAWVVQRRADETLCELPEISGPKEVKRLKDAFAALLVSLEQKSSGLERSREKLATTQQQLAHRDRLVTVGRVASGIAHEVGNPLSSVIGFLSLLRTPNDLAMMGMQTEDVIQRMDNELERIRKAIRSLLDLSQPVAVLPRSFDLQTVVDDVETIVRVRTKKTTIHKALGPSELRQIYFDPSLLLQVLSNLCLNAVEAMEGEGSIVLTLLEVDEQTVQLCLTDDGPGIEPEILDVIFDEFQTTKREQGGTGLGLSISRSLLRLGGGGLSLMAPQPEVGAGFVVSLPRRSNR